MTTARALCLIQVALSIGYLVLALTTPSAARGFLIVLLYLATFIVNRYCLYRVKRKYRRREHEAASH